MKTSKLVHLKFLDHAYFSGYEAKPLECEVFGRLYKEDKDAYYIATWISDGILDDNTEQYVILKSAVTKKKIIT